MDDRVLLTARLKSQSLLKPHKKFYFFLNQVILAPKLPRLNKYNKYER